MDRVARLQTQGALIDHEPLVVVAITGHVENIGRFGMGHWGNNSCKSFMRTVHAA